MRMFHIFKKEIMQNIRDKKSMFMMVVFPMLMIFILGTAFSGSFSSASTVPKIKVVYSLNKNAKVSKNFRKFMKEIGKEMNIETKEMKEESKAIELIRNGNYDSYIQIKSDEKIVLATNNLRVFNASLVKSLIDTFVERVNMIEKIVEVNPMGMSKVEEKARPNYVNVKSISSNEEPRAMDYYTITMFTMIILYSTATGAMSIISEKRRRTLNRMICSSVSRLEILFGKVLGCICITIFQVGIVFLLTKYILKSQWGSNVHTILFISFSLIIMAVSVGVGLASLIKNENIMAVAINTVIPVFVFLGGGYIPLDIFNSSFLNNLCKVSPIKWTNDAIFKVIYGNDFSYVATAIIINFVIAFVFLSIPILTSRKDVA